ncbi:uncharacterized protein LOC134768817 [Penaeus indicus]|uniref:uncharacterized protein LOC134768817 n=1 Tax=Penaeus indicus TaxID=29960 RepID=UPI00300D74C7
MGLSDEEPQHGSMEGSAASVDGWMKNQSKRAKQHRGTAKGKLTRKLEKFYEHVKDKVALEILEDNYNLIVKAFEEVELANESYCNLLDETSDTQELKSADIYIKELDDKKCAAHVLFVKIKDEMQMKGAIKVKSIDIPKFDGKIRDYSNFKRDYVRLMQPNYGKDPFALRQCLSGEALDSICGVEHDFDKMFARLDDMYSDSRRVIDVVIEDLREIEPVVEGDSLGFIRMVDKIEQNFLYLDQLGLSSELNTANMTSQIEKLLPPTQKREWIKIAENVEPVELFKKLLEYLLGERKSLKYLIASVRNPVNTKARVNYAVYNQDRISSDHTEESEIMKRLSDVEKAVTNINNLVIKLTEEKSEEKRSIGTLSTHLNRCWYHGTDGHDILDCATFQKLNNSEKFEILRKRGICFNCLKGIHVSRRCFKKSRCSATDANNQTCGKLHHTSLHENQIVGSSYVSLKRNGVMFMVNKIKCNNQVLNTLFDSGADVTMIRNDMAASLGLKGKHIRLAVTKLGNQTVTYNSKEYDLVLTDKQGNNVNITAYGIDEITSCINKVNLSHVKHLFKSTDVCQLDRPHGKIDLLIGADYCSLIPTVKETVGENLQLMESRFGMCVRGSHPSIACASGTRDIVGIRINHISGIIYDKDITVEPKSDIKDQIDKFFTVEYLGTECNPRCGDCKCGKCAVGNNDYSIRGERELALIEKGLQYDSEKKQWSAKFPWVKDPNLLQNNISVAVAKLRSTEKRLLKLGPEYAKAYNNQIRDMIKRDVARKLTPDEIKGYAGPITYLQHHEVLKPGSTSTPIRIVFNSSAKFMGQSLNSFWAKGPDVLNSMVGILLRFREGAIGIAGDISKMYNSIKLPEMEQHVRRFVWRDFQLNCEPEHYVLTSMGFGDKPSGIIAMLALKHTAELWMEKYPDAASMIISNSYVDDIIQSVESKEKALQLIQETEKILSYGNFKVKQWIMTGDVDKDDLDFSENEGDKILGLYWDRWNDEFKFKARLNFSPKYKGIRTGPDLKFSNFICNIPPVLTKRIVISQMCSVYDPLGLLLPYTLKAKILLRETVSCSTKLGWDDPLPAHMKEQWVVHFHKLFGIDSLSFERCIKPPTAIGLPMLVIFSDSSSNAYGAVAYARWKMKSGMFESKLIMAKGRIAPTRQLSIPRLELCGAIISCRLRKLIENELSYRFSSVMHITDSAIVRAQIQKESYGFGTFVATRVAEVQSKSNPNEWWWIASCHNPADLLTRPNDPSDIIISSLWKYGPKFMTLPKEEWPISQSIECDLPDRVHVNLTHCLKDSDECVIDLSKFKNYNKLIAVTGRILNVMKIRSLKGILLRLEPDILNEALQFWIRQAQKCFSGNWKQKYQRLGPYKTENGIIMVGQRLEYWLKQNWNQDNFILLPRKHLFTILYISHLHNIDHAGVDVTLSKLQTKFWVPSARKVIRAVKRKCVTCRRLDYKVEGQCMGQVATERITPCPAFYHTATDIFGPFQIRDNVKKRTTGKAYGVIFNCMVTRAVYIDVVDGYDTHSFLKTFRRFTAVHGYPATVHSDLGSQLVSASKELQIAINNWNMSDISEFGTKGGLKWIFNRSADAAWQNGVSESLIKSVKRSLAMIIGSTLMTYSGLQTIFFEIANLMNERPIGLKPGMDLELGTYLCPNDLLLGRASNHAPCGPWKDSFNTKRRLDYIQNVVNTFWRKWQRDYFPTLIVRQKWHTDKRNLQSGDIVLIQDSNTVKGKWKMGQVVKVEKGRDTKVRDVSIRYKVQKPGKEYKGQSDTIIRRSVHKLVVLLPVEEQ